MQILVVDASRKKAAVRSRRVLSKFLMALGTDTFAGRMSEEGLKDLIAELKEGASRNTAIAIHRVTTRDRMELVGVVGSKDCFDKEGRWAFKTRTLATNPNAPSAMVELLMNVSTLGGLVHDIGKINHQFQAALLGDAGPQKIRHDVLGAMLFREVIAITHARADKKDWLTVAAEDPLALFGPLVNADGTFNCSKLTQSALAEDPSGSGIYKAGLSNFLFSPKMRTTYPEAVAVFYLALTHHHHIRKGKKEDGADGEPSLWRHVHKSIPLLAEQNLKAPTQGLPWHSEKWCQTFKAAATNILALRQKHPEVISTLVGNDLKTLTSVVTQVLRPALIIADQGASTMQEDVLRNGSRGTKHLPDVLYANCWGKQGLMGDTLATHLHSVGRRSRSMTRLLLEPASGLFPRTTAPAADTGSLLGAMPEPGTKFYWQREAEEALRAIHDIEKTPFFAAVLSAPGSGKTAGGPRILSAACKGDLRFSLGVGRRSLTLQTGTAYEELLKFAPEDVATMVGDAASRMLYAAENKDNTEQAPEAEQLTAEQATLQQPGSECLQSDEDLFVFDNEDLLAKRELGAWVQLVQPKHKITSGTGFLANKTTRLIDTPILVATIDHLSGAATQSKTKESHLLLRVTNSDLILDELDDLSPHDLVTIGKLVHLYGVYGRRVIVMSGTLNNYLAQQMYTAWLEGLKVHRAITGSSVPSCLALISNLSKPTILREPDTAVLQAAVDKFCSDFANELEVQPARTVVSLLPLTPESDRQHPCWPQALLKASFELHNDFAVVDPKTQVRLSIGAVRFNAVRNSQAFARHLLNREAGAGEPMVKVICYHAKFPTFLRALLERQLDALLLRESYALPAGQEFAEVPALREALNEAKDAGCTDLCVILSTTSIEETGRNHDLDWAITEPHSERSLTQLAGRVLRHRKKLPGGKPNILVTSLTLNSVEGVGLPYGAPGVQGDLFTKTETWLVQHPDPTKGLARALTAAGIRFGKGVSDTEIRAQELLPFNAWSRGITPAPVLRAPADYESRRLAALQHLEMRFALETSKDILVQGQPPLSLKEYFESSVDKAPLGLTSVHHEQVQFRDGDEFTRELCMTLTRDKLFVVVENNTPDSSFHAPHQEELFRYPQRDLFQWAGRWKQDLTTLCQDNGWEVNSALLILGRGQAPWSRASESLLITKNSCFRFSFELGFGKLA